MSIERQRARASDRLALSPMSLPNMIRVPAVTTRLGSALLTLMPRRAAALKAGRLPDEPDFVDHMLIAGLVRDYERRGRLDELTALHDWFWSNGRAALQFHEFAERRFERWFLGHHVAIVPALRAALETDDVRYATLCEIGCGCGRALQHLAREFPTIPRIVGLDLCAEQTARNRERYAGERMEFEAGDGLAWIERHAEPGWVYFVYGGVLEFFAHEKVLELFRLLGSRLAPSMLAMVEPLSDDHDLANEPQSKAYGAEKTFSHNHLELLSAAGFDVLSRTEQHVDRQRWLLVVARSTAAAARTTPR
jgi:SAM-dependent methyltransferase